MNRRLLWTLGLLLVTTSLPAVAGAQMLLIARDNEKHLLSGFIFAYQGVESTKTNRAGAAEIALPPEHPPGRRIEIQLVASPKKDDEWFLVNPQINIPEPAGSAEIVLMKRSTFRQIATPRAGARTGDLTVEDRKQILVEEAARRGLTAAQLDAAIRSFAETQDPKDRGIVAYLNGRYLKAEELLGGAAEKKEGDLVETLQYLGAAQYEQGKYHASADTFRKALGLRSEDADLLGDLGESLNMLAEWAEAESLMRHSLAITEKKHGPEHPDLAMNLNNLASLLLDTNRIAEAELLFRRALTIDEKTFGQEDPRVAQVLNNLAVSLGALNRISEAEPLLRRALAIDEKSYGPENPEVGKHLSNLAQLLKDTNRLSEAEPLARRALAMTEKGLGPEHPQVAQSLIHLAAVLYATKRLSEAELLMRRALAIDEKSFGPEHPQVASDLNHIVVLLLDTNPCSEAEAMERRALSIHEKRFGDENPLVAADLDNLAQVLKATNRCSEAEPLMRRALAIDEKSFGPEDSRVASHLNNLALLLHNMNRLAEAEPLMRRALVILLDLRRKSGSEDPRQAAFSRNYRKILKAMYKSDAEIEATFETLRVEHPLVNRSLPPPPR